MSQVGNEGTFYETVNELSLQGGEAEPYIIDALRTDADWGVRLGCLHVLDGGHQGCFASNIDAIDDQSQVAKGDFARGISDHDILETDAAPNIPLPESMGGLVDCRNGIRAMPNVATTGSNGLNNKATIAAINQPLAFVARITTKE